MCYYFRISSLAFIQVALAVCGTSRSSQLEDCSELTVTESQEARRQDGLFRTDVTMRTRTKRPRPARAFANARNSYMRTRYANAICEQGAVECINQLELNI